VSVQDPRVETTPELTGEQADAVRRLIAAVTAADGARPVSDSTMLRLNHSPAGGRHLLLWTGSELAGYAHLETGGVRPEAEIAVVPEARTSGADRLLLDEVRRAAAGPIQLWAHGERSGVLDLARAAGLEPDRVLLQLRRPLDSPSLEEPKWPDGVTVRTFVPGQDEAAWLKVNNRAFADHPEQGGWGVEDVRIREQEPWFDPDGFLLAEREADGAIVGFHWTKVHGGMQPGAGAAQGGGVRPAGTDGGDDRPERTGEGHAHEPIGEVYVVGVDPSAQGQGLGVALTLAGLRYLRSRGLSQVMLYVDESNTAAIGVYTKLGFTRWDVDVQYRRP
jgi:mycothiol synthase